MNDFLTPTGQGDREDAMVSMDGDGENPSASVFHRIISK